MSSALPPWEDLVAGRGCPFCLPRPDNNEFWTKIGDLSVSSLYLDRNQTYRGYCLLVFNPRHETGIEKLTADEYTAFMQDLRRASLAVFESVPADHMNYATLGNVIAHAHYHIIPRYKTDPRWGAPVWVSDLKDMQVTRLPEAELQDLAEKIRQKL